MACLLLFKAMYFGLFKTLVRHFAAALFGLLFVISVSLEAAGQTGTAFFPKTIDAMVGSKNTETEFALEKLDSQPSLQKHIEKIKHLRLLLKTQSVNSSLDTYELGQDRSVVISTSPLIKRLARAEEKTDEAVKLAIMELEYSIAARTGPSAPLPGAGVVLVMKQISNFSAHNMIKALRAGGEPIYSDVGHLIGVQDPDTHRLLGGRKG
jgi:hypothetical protein